MDTQLEQIRRSLTRAVAREQQVQDELIVAEQDGRDVDAVRLRRELNELAQSIDELRAALDVIEARIEVAQAAREPAQAGPSRKAEESEAARDSLSGAEEPDDLAARKSRLVAPERRQTPDATPDQR
jgi:prophage tail gpP-like protein